MYHIALACVSVLIASGCCQDRFSSMTPATTHRYRSRLGPISSRPVYRYRARYTTPRPQRFDVPDICNTSYDAITMLRKELFVFKGQYFWRIVRDGVYPGYPVEIHRFFHLPADVDHVDAVYERSRDRRIVFFVGRKYFVFYGNVMEAGYPRPLTDLGLPSTLEKIDGAMVWGHNGFTYLFSGHQYWRFDESVGRVQLDYPRDMSEFAGVGYDIDTVFQWVNGKTYFVKGKGYWEFDDLRMRVAHEMQKPSAPFFMGCLEVTEVTEVTKVTEVAEMPEVTEMPDVEGDVDRYQTVLEWLKKIYHRLANSRAISS